MYYTQYTSMARLATYLPVFFALHSTIYCKQYLHVMYVRCTLQLFSMLNMKEVTFTWTLEKNQCQCWAKLRTASNFTRIILPYTYKFLRYVNFKDVTNPAFMQFYFCGSSTLRKIVNFVISNTHDSQSFANEILRMKISWKISWPWKSWKLHPS